MISLFDYCIDPFILLWIFIIIFIIIIVAVIIFNFIKQMVLFQATRDEKWYPYNKCDTKNSKINLDDKVIENSEGDLCNYKHKFKDGYLIINDQYHRLFSRHELNKIKQSKVFNIGELHYINIWKFEQFPAKRMVLYYHGNNDNISYRKYVIDICYLLGLNLTLVDYRGYGDSSSLPNNKFLLEDAKCAYLHIATHYSPDDIIIWGESLGGIAAIYTAHKYKCNTLILLSTFADLRTIVDKLDVNPGFKKILNIMANNKLMKNGKWIKNVSVPTVIIHSPEDDILPYINAKMLLENVDTDDKKLINITGPHAHPYFKYENLEELTEFIHIDKDISKNINTMNKVLDIINNI